MQDVTYATHGLNLHPFEAMELEMVDPQNDNQATVRMDKILKTAIEKWLRTEEAKEKGYSSLASFVNKGARKLYEKESTPEERPTHFVLPNMKDHHLTLDLDIYEDKTHCNMCDSEKCIHIEILHTDSTVKKYMKKYNIQPKSKQK